MPDSLQFMFAAFPTELKQSGVPSLDVPTLAGSSGTRKTGKTPAISKGRRTSPIHVGKRFLTLPYLRKGGLYMLYEWSRGPHTATPWLGRGEATQLCKGNLGEHCPIYVKKEDQLYNTMGKCDVETNTWRTGTTAARKGREIYCVLYRSLLFPIVLNRSLFLPSVLFRFILLLLFPIVLIVPHCFLLFPIVPYRSTSLSIIRYRSLLFHVIFYNSL